jgi:hypothetical protein
LLQYVLFVAEFRVKLGRPGPDNLFDRGIEAAKQYQQSLGRMEIAHPDESGVYKGILKEKIVAKHQDRANLIDKSDLTMYQLYILSV